MTMEELEKVELHFSEDGTTVLLFAPGDEHWVISSRQIPRRPATAAVQALFAGEPGNGS